METGRDTLRSAEWLSMEWQSTDGSMVKTPLVLESVDGIPLIVVEMGTKRSILAKSSGVSLAVIISKANTHDVKLLEKSLDASIITRTEVIEHTPQHL